MIRAFREILFEDVHRHDERWTGRHTVAWVVIGIVIVGTLAALHYCRRFVLGY